MGGSESLNAKLGRWTVLLGVVQIMVGCLVGFVPPPAVGWFRGIVMAHIEYTANGMLMVAFGLLCPRLALGRAALGTWFVTLQIGTWTNGTAGLLGAILGASSELLPTLNEKFPAPHAHHAAVSGLLKVCGLTMIIALALTIAGLLRERTDATADR
jgi:hypothetical protein